MCTFPARTVGTVPAEKPPSFQWMLPRLLSVALQKELRCFLEARFAIEERHQ